MVGFFQPIPGNANIGFPSYGGLQPVPTPRDGFTQNPDPRQQSPTRFYQPPLGVVPISVNSADGFLYLDSRGFAPTFFDGFKVGNPNVYSPPVTGILNGVDATIEQMNMFNAFQQGVPGAIDPSYLWLDDNLLAQANGVGAGGQNVQMRAPGQPVNPRQPPAA